MKHYISSLRSIALLFIFLYLPLQATPVKIMPLGDSITWDWYYGDNRTDAYRHGYRNHLWYKLQERGYDVDFVGSRSNGGAVTPHFDGDNNGHTGWTTSQIRDNVYGYLQHSKPDIVLLHIGTNDMMYVSPPSAVNGVEQILDEIHRFEQNYHVKIYVVLATIVNCHKNPSWVSEFNNDLRSMAADRINRGERLTLVEMYGPVGDNLIDGIHPNDTGYTIMANVWYDAVSKIIDAHYSYAWLVPALSILLN
jgi:lysophospholipase L1-like esterase